MEHLLLAWWDYLLFSATLFLSVAIGVYYGCYKKGHPSMADYSFGARDMKLFPVGMSLAATIISGSVLLSFPAEVYLYGISIWLYAVTLVPVTLAMHFVFLPVFYKLKITSLYEYFEVRFDGTVRKFASFLYVCYSFTYLPLAIYGPALALNQVTGFNTNIISSTGLLICICYTAMGGFKAVVWADTLQMVVILCGILTTFTIGLNSAGGLISVWQKAQTGERLQFFDMNPDPSQRDTFWTIFVGGTMFTLIHLQLQPGSAQRYLALKDLKSAKRIVNISAAIVSIVVVTVVASGIVIYARYHDCDPLSRGHISKVDQLVPYYISDVGRSIKGLSGLYIAGLFCAGFSTTSTILNVLPGIIYADFLRPIVPAGASERQITLILKLLTVAVGIVALCLVLVIGRFGSIFEIMWSLGGIIHGPILGLFTMGILFGVVNSKGALCGTSSSLIIMACFLIKKKLTPGLHDQTKPLNVYGCANMSTENTSSAVVNATSTTRDEQFVLLKLSLNYYVMVGCLIAVINGILVSLITRSKNCSLSNPDAVSPLVYRFLRKFHGDHSNANAELELIVDKQNRNESENVVRDKLLCINSCN